MLKAANNNDDNDDNTRISDEKLASEKSEGVHYCEVVSSFHYYATDSFQEVELAERRWNMIDNKLRLLLPLRVNQFKAWREAIIHNQEFLRTITKHKHIFHTSTYLNYAVLHRKCEEYPPAQRNRSKMRSTLRQCVRDWSVEGVTERDICYGSILRELKRLYADVAFIDRGRIKVLIPGSGLGRLPWECAQLGFDSQGNEFSYHMLLTSYLILNCTNEANLYDIYPFVHEATNVFNTQDHLRKVTIPDVVPTRMNVQSLFSMSAGDFLEVYGAGRSRAMNSDPREYTAHEAHALYAHADRWNVVTTCYFLDTANNVLEYIRCISHILKLGGHWINFGPLLYHFADMPNEMSIELSYEEIKSVIEPLGLRMIKEETNIPSAYACNPKSMHQTVYNCVSFTCVKVQNPTH